MQMACRLAVEPRHASSSARNLPRQLVTDAAGRMS